MFGLAGFGCFLLCFVVFGCFVLFLLMVERIFLGKYREYSRYNSHVGKVA